MTFESTGGDRYSWGERIPGEIRTNDFVPGSQAIEPMEFSSPFFIAGATLANIFKGVDLFFGTSTTVEKSDFVVTEQGVEIPQAEGKYEIPRDLVGNPHSPPGTTSYGKIEKGKFQETLRIDPATPAGKKGPNYSHYHKGGKGKHYSPNGKDKDPGF
jgi:hypothetical protein